MRLFNSKHTLNSSQILNNNIDQFCQKYSTFCEKYPWLECKPGLINDGIYNSLIEIFEKFKKNAENITNKKNMNDFLQFYKMLINYSFNYRNVLEILNNVSYLQSLIGENIIDLSSDKNILAKHFDNKNITFDNQLKLFLQFINEFSFIIQQLDFSNLSNKEQELFKDKIRYLLELPQKKKNELNALGLDSFQQIFIELLENSQSLKNVLQSYRNNSISSNLFVLSSASEASEASESSSSIDSLSFSYFDQGFTHGSIHGLRAEVIQFGDAQLEIRYLPKKIGMSSNQVLASLHYRNDGWVGTIQQKPIENYLEISPNDIQYFANKSNELLLLHRNITRENWNESLIKVENITQKMSRKVTGFFNQEMLEVLFKTNHIPIRLSLDYKLNIIPFEWINYEGKWLWETHPVGRIMMVPDANLQPVKAAKTFGLRVLIIQSHDAEIRKVAEPMLRDVVNLLDEARSQGHPVFYKFLYSPTKKEIESCLIKDKSYDIVLFDGHGFFNQENPMDSGFVLTNPQGEVVDVLNANDLDIIFLKASTLPLIWLAISCESGRIEPGKYDRFTHQHINQTLVDVFINHHVNLIAAPWSVNVYTSGLFSLTFFKEILELTNGITKTLGEIVLKAKAYTRDGKYKNFINGKNVDFTWLAYILFGNPSIALKIENNQK